MCLAIPAVVTHLDGQMATVALAGVTRRASIHLVEDVQVGDYVMIHAGFALAKLDEEEARETMRVLEAVGGLEPGELESGLGVAPPPQAGGDKP